MPEKKTKVLGKRYTWWKSFIIMQSIPLPKIQRITYGGDPKNDFSYHVGQTFRVPDMTLDKLNNGRNTISSVWRYEICYIC